MPSIKRILPLAVVAVTILQALSAEAKVSETIRGNYDDLWSACVRLIRVDKDWQIIDKDKETGFIIFTFVADSGQPSRASVEILRDRHRKEKASESYTVQVGIPSASSIEERMFISALRSKLRQEY